MAETAIDNANEEILAALTADVEGAVVQGGPTRLTEMINHEEEGENITLASKVYQDAGTVAIYDRRTGLKSYTSVNILPAQLKKVDDEGERMFTRYPPKEAPKVGVLKCMLHPDDRQPEYDEWGLPRCRKANITSPMQVEQHMRHRHPVEWATIERDRTRREKEEERQWQRQIAQAATADKQPVAVAAKGEAPIAKGPFGRPVKTT